MCGGQRARPPLRARPQRRLAGLLREHRGTQALGSVRCRVAVYTRLAGSVAGWSSSSWGRHGSAFQRSQDVVRRYPSNSVSAHAASQAVTGVPQARGSCGQPLQSARPADELTASTTARAVGVASWDLIRKGMWPLGPAAACTGETSRGAAAAPRTCSSQFYATPDPRGVVATIPT